jgi:hypothetical protein
MSRDLLKEAIADAKAVKETAIASAKAALAESFAPHLQELFATKINELDEEETYEGKEMKDAKKAKGKKEMEERLETINDPKGSYEHGNLAEENELEEMELEELLAELSKEKMDEEETYESLFEEEEVEINDEEMSDDEMEEIIQDVIADMIENGELVAGPNFGKEGEEMMGDEMPVDEDVDGDYENAPKKFKDTSSKGYFELDENSSSLTDSDIDSFFDTMYDSDQIFDILDDAGIDWVTEFGVDDDEEIQDIMDDRMDDFLQYVVDEHPEIVKKLSDESEVDLDEILNEIKKEMAKETMSKKSKSVSEKEMEEGKKEDADKKKMKKELEEAYDAIKTLRSEMNEVNLLNAKLLYTNKVFRAKNLTESQKVKVLETFDKATTVKEVKLVFESLSFDTKPSKIIKNPIRESLGGASKAMNTSNTKRPILEVNEQFSRMQKLAGIIK